MKATIRIELQSEAIFGSGQSTPGVVDLEVLHDEYGFPYYRAKSLKGHLREQMTVLKQMLDRLPHSEQIAHTVDKCFGQSNIYHVMPGVLKFTDAEIRQSIRQPFMDAIHARILTPEEVLRALTDIRYFTSIDRNTGSVENGTLRQYRVVRPNLVFESRVDGIDQLNEFELGLLAASVANLRYIGTMKNRGKGEVRCRLWVDDRDVTLEYIDSLRKWVTSA